MGVDAVFGIALIAFVFGMLVCCMLSHSGKEKQAEVIKKEVYEEPYQKPKIMEIGQKTNGDAAEETDDKAIERALDAILDIRRFEIELYWKRANYFWAFMVLVYGAYGYLSLQRISQTQAQLIWFVSWFGLFLSVAWHLVNKGSKYWQENWENQLDLLEDQYHGPLYKTVVSRPPIDLWDVCGHIRGVIVGPSPYSVSKINSILSFANIGLWTYVTSKELWFSNLDPVLERWLISSITIILVAMLLIRGRTDNNNHENLVARRRKVKIK